MYETLEIEQVGGIVMLCSSEAARAGFGAFLDKRPASWVSLR